MNTHMLIGTYGIFIVALLALYIPLIWRSNVRQMYAGALAVLSGVMVGAALFLEPASLYVPLACVQLYAIGNIFRIAENRMNEHYMRRVTARTALCLLLFQFGYTVIWWLASMASTLSNVFVFLSFQTLFVLMLAVTTKRRIQTSRFVYQNDAIHNVTPTVTVAIPARNETRDLQECLQSLLDSNYSKLEIIVLDDCSQGKRTAEIIKIFAHAGVRFIQGEQVRDYWLAKNQAYDALVDAASGEIILFCGVDTRFEPHTIQQMVNQLLLTKKRMISFMPVRYTNAAALWSPAQFNRYFRELAYPRIILRRPPVLSTCFLLYREDIFTFGGFDAVRHSINPEGYFAKQLAMQHAYSFVRSTSMLGLSSTKLPYDHRQTALRTMYPQAHKQPERVLLITAGTLVGMYGSLLFIGLAVFRVLPVYIGIFAIINTCIWLYTYGEIVRATGVNQSVRAAPYVLFVSLYDAVLLHLSMIKYEFSEVRWKGRNICEPIMHVLPHLPPLDEERKL